MSLVLLIQFLDCGTRLDPHVAAPVEKRVFSINEKDTDREYAPLIILPEELNLLLALLALLALLVQLQIKSQASENRF